MNENIGGQDQDSSESEIFINPSQNSSLQPKSSSKRGIFIAIILILIILTASAGIWYWYKNLKIKPSSETQPVQTQVQTSPKSSETESETINPGWQSHANMDAKFTIEYPPDWEIKAEYYYETAAGEKATTPTIIFGRKSDPTEVASNQIIINGRQISCTIEQAVMSTEQLDGTTLTVYKYPDNSWCIFAQKNGKDMNNNQTTYDFVIRYDDVSVKQIFEGVLKSFKVTS